MDHLEQLEKAPPGGLEAASGWRFAGVSLVGSGHLTGGLPCQDAHALQLAEGPAGPHLIALVSDGAGSARHAQEGSRAACDCAEQVLAGQLAGGGLDALDASALLAAVRAHLEERAAELNSSPRELACTLLAAVLGPQGAFFWQVGDGGMVFGPGSGTDLELAFWPDGGEYANQTSFVTDAAPGQVQTRRVAGSVRQLALFSDGLQMLCLRYDERAPHPPFFAPFFEALAHTPEREDFERALANTLVQPRVRARTDDDLTLLLALHL